MRIVFAGGGAKEYRQYLETVNANRLFSIFHEERYIKKYSPKRWLMIDSGAHSWNKFTITKIGHSSSVKLPPIEDYLQNYRTLMSKLHSNLNWYWVEFDVYGHRKKELIDEDYLKMLRLVPKERILRVYHPIIDGGSCAVLKQWIDEGQTYIGIGNDSIPILGDIFRLTRDKVKVHGFAMTKLDLVRHYPFYSVDSTSPLASMMYGTVMVEGLKQQAKKRMLKEKDYRVFRKPLDNTIDGINKILKTEKELTDLWAKKGIVWHD